MTESFFPTTLQGRALRARFLCKNEKRKDQSCKAVSAFALVFMYGVCRLYGLRAYTTLCKPSVFSISSITPSVATIIMVASAAMVGSK